MPDAEDVTTRPPTRPAGSSRRTLVIVAAWTVALACGMAVAAWWSARPDQQIPSEVAKPKRWVTRIVFDDHGNPVAVEHKWPFGRPDNIGLVRIPWGYRDLLLGPEPADQLSDNVHSRSLDDGYAPIFVWAITPDLLPHHTLPPTDVLGRRDKFTFMVSPVMNARYPVWDGKALVQRLAEGRLETLNLVNANRDDKQRLTPVFGLNRIGPARAIANPKADLGFLSTHDEFLYDGSTPGTSSTYIICNSDLRNDGQPEPNVGEIRFCEQHFAIDALNGSVKVIYQKKYLPLWHEIMIKSTTLLDTFIISNF